VNERSEVGFRGVLLLALPAIFSFLLNNGYRINDQYWVQGLGPEAHAALGACTPILIMNFAAVFLAIGGALPLVARATGAGRKGERDEVIRHALVLGGIIALFLCIVGWSLTPTVTGFLDVDGDTAALANRYLRFIYLGILPLVTAPIIDNIFIGMGNTKVPMILQSLAVVCNLVLNPLFIYGAGSFEGLGIEGAALATCLSRAITTVLGLLVLRRMYGVHFLEGGPPRVRRLLNMVRLGLPMGLTIAFFSGVYLVLLALVISRLGRDVVGAFGIGFNTFESISFPFFLGIGLAGSSLVGRSLGAGDEAAAWKTVATVRRLGRLAGVTAALFFWFGGRWIAPLFTDDPGVLEETLRYVSILAFSQPFVAEEIVNEKILYGAGHPLAIFLISAPVNLLRIPQAWLLSQPLGLAAGGVWWAINATTYLKAGLFYWMVRRGQWIAPIDEATDPPPGELPAR
jgi:putative MATE family efflux protein